MSEVKHIFSSRIVSVFIDCDEFEYVGSQSIYSQVESFVSSSIVMIWQFWISGSKLLGVKANNLKSNSVSWVSRVSWVSPVCRVYRVCRVRRVGWTILDFGCEFPNVGVCAGVKMYSTQVGNGQPRFTTQTIQVPPFPKFRQNPNPERMKGGIVLKYKPASLRFPAGYYWEAPIGSAGNPEGSGDALRTKYRRRMREQKGGHEIANNT